MSHLNLSASAPFKEHRSVPRYTLVAAAEITDSASGLRLTGRLSELSRKGCYVDIMTTLPKDTAVELVFSRDKGIFATPGRVIYAQDSMGMGFAFVDTDANQLKVLDDWLAEISSQR